MFESAKNSNSRTPSKIREMSSSMLYTIEFQVLAKLICALFRRIICFIYKLLHETKGFEGEKDRDLKLVHGSNPVG